MRHVARPRSRQHRSAAGRAALLLAAPSLVAALALSATATPGAADPAGTADASELTVWVPTGSFASSSFERVPQQAGEAAVEPAPATLNLSAVRNAPMSAQLAVTAHTDLHDLTVEVAARPPRGTRPLPSDAITVRYPDFIPSTGTDDVVADPLRTGPVDVAAGTNQPVWLTVDVPARLPAGTYGTTLSVKVAGRTVAHHQLVVDAAGVTLADPQGYDFYLNLWLQPDAVAYAHDTPVFSEEHWRLLDSYLDDMASRGQSVINAAIIEDPWEIGWPDGTWRAQTYHPFHSMVDWRYDGRNWDFGYENFDRYVEASLRAGIGPDIRVYALLMFGGRERLFYTDTRTGETVREVVELGDDRWREAWAAFLDDFGAHLKDRGWFDDTMLAFDERPSATMAVVQDFLAESAPEFADKIHVAVHTMDVDLDIPDISFAHGLLPELAPEYVEARRAAGEITTFYTTGGPLTPNTITATPPVGARLLGWVPVQHGLDGYLRWSYNSWPADPFTDPAYRYAQGDEYIVYPGNDGPMSSIRWETFRDGVVDHELLRRLARHAGEDNPVYREALALIDTEAAPSPELYADVVAARAMVVDELERFSGVSVRTAPEPRQVTAGEQFDVEVVVGNTDEHHPLVDVEAALQAGPEWAVEPLDATHARRLAPGEQLRARFRVSVPDSTGTGVETLTGTAVMRRDGKPVSLESPAELDVLAGAGIENVRAEPVDLGAGEAATVTAEIVNRRDRETAVSAALAVPDGWSAEPPAHDVVLAPGQRQPVTFQARPSGSAPAGRHDLTVTVAVAGAVVERTDASVFYNEAEIDATIHSVSSEELAGEDGAAANLVDGDPLTHWHSRWSDTVAGPPHEVVLDLGAERTVHALRYLPRQTGGLNGGVKDYEVYVSSTPGDWGEPVAAGAFGGGRDEQRADFTPTPGRYLRFVVLSEQAGQPFASGAELTPLGDAALLASR